MLSDNSVGKLSWTKRNGLTHTDRRIDIQCDLYNRSPPHLKMCKPTEMDKIDLLSDHQISLNQEGEELPR